MDRCGVRRGHTGPARLALVIAFIAGAAGCASEQELPLEDDEVVAGEGPRREEPQEPSRTQDPRARCAELSAAEVPDTTVLQAEFITEGPAGVEHCAVTASVRTGGDASKGSNEVRFNLGLPTTWNGDFYFLGVGGFRR